MRVDSVFFMKTTYEKPRCEVIKVNNVTVLAPMSLPPGGTEGTDDIDLDDLLLQWNDCVF